MVRAKFNTVLQTHNTLRHHVAGMKALTCCAIKTGAKRRKPSLLPQSMSAVLQADLRRDCDPYNCAPAGLALHASFGYIRE